MTGAVKRFSINEHGRDYAVGDIHGHFTLLQARLDAAGFDPSVDRLFSVGDLVDRGPECELVLDWLAKPWFHPVRGNHDDYVCRFDTCDIGNWAANGGSWFSPLPYDQKEVYAAEFRKIPIAIEVVTPRGLVGIVHADCPFPSWADLRAELCDDIEKGAVGSKRMREVRNYCMWSRNRIERSDTSGVDGVIAVVVGHTPLKQCAVLGNVYHIDTAGWRPQHGGSFTLLDLATLWPAL